MTKVHYQCQFCGTQIEENTGRLNERADATLVISQSSIKVGQNLKGFQSSKGLKQEKKSVQHNFFIKSQTAIIESS